MDYLVKLDFPWISTQNTCDRSTGRNITSLTFFFSFLKHGFANVAQAGSMHLLLSSPPRTRIISVHHYAWLGLVLMPTAPHWPLTPAPGWGCLCMNVWNGLHVVRRLGFLALVPEPLALTQPSR